MAMNLPGKWVDRVLKTKGSISLFDTPTSVIDAVVSTFAVASFLGFLGFGKTKTLT
jgi:hypothetical protein